MDHDQTAQQQSRSRRIVDGPSGQQIHPCPVLIVHFLDLAVDFLYLEVRPLDRRLAVPFAAPPSDVSLHLG